MARLWVGLLCGALFGAGLVLSGMTDTAERQASVTFVDYFTSGPQLYTLAKREEIKELLQRFSVVEGQEKRATLTLA